MVWRGTLLGPDGTPQAHPRFILKRMLLEKGQHVLQAGVREVYFGELLRAQGGHAHVARYVEHFYQRGGGGSGSGSGRGGWEAGAVPKELWLVFRDEGLSLRHYLYTEREADGFVLHGQSDFWRQMRLDPNGPQVMKNILRQVLEGVKYLHGMGILHRDLKPSNLIVSLGHQPPRKEGSGAGGGGGGGEAAAGAGAEGTGASRGQDGSGATASGVGAEGGEEEQEREGGGAREGRSGRGGGGRAGGGGTGNSTTTTGDSAPGARARARTGPGGTAGGGGAGAGAGAEAWQAVVKIADFSSAVDEGALEAGLYGPGGPTQAESTLEYAPPEVLFESEVAYSRSRPESYDAWSVGIILLELLLGTPEVFTVDQRTRAILDRHLVGEGDAARSKAHLLAAMADMCIYSPGSGTGASAAGPSPAGAGRGGPRGGGGGGGGGEEEGDTRRRWAHWPLGDRAVVDESCTLAHLGMALHTRDPLDVGFPDQWGLDLLWRLLRWDPEERISVEDALEHAYFKGPYSSRRDGSEHATRRDAAVYDGWYTGGAPHPRGSSLTKAPSSGRSTWWGWGATSPPTSLLESEGDAAETAAAAGGDLLEPAWRGQEGLIPTVAAAATGELAPPSFQLNHKHALDMDFVCPKCNRTFGVWKSCDTHVKGRGHAHFCAYDTVDLPPCISSHSMLPFDPHSGWCDMQGRRAKIEDYHSIVFAEDYKFYGVFDGHCGTKAAKFTSRALHVNLELFLNAAKDQAATTATAAAAADQAAGRHPGSGGGHDGSQSGRVISLEPSDGEMGVEAIEAAVRDAFRKTQADFLGAHGGAGAAAAGTAAGGAGGSAVAGGGTAGAGAGAGGGEVDDSGTTATVALVYPSKTVVAHVGDSRAVLCCDEEGWAVAVTRDHTPYHGGERARVEANGGSVELRGVLRVQGELAVTRTIGNHRLSSLGYLSSEPDVTVIRHWRHPITGAATTGGHVGGGSSGEGGRASGRGRAGAPGPSGTTGDVGGGGGGGHQMAPRSPSFLVLASDGLWDVMSDQEAVRMVLEVMEGVTGGEGSDGRGTAAAAALHEQDVLAPKTDTLATAPDTASGEPRAAVPGPRAEAQAHAHTAPGPGPRSGVRRSRTYGRYGGDQVFQVAATALTLEAYVRGSTDNIGVCVVDLRPPPPPPAGVGAAAAA